MSILITQICHTNRLNATNALHCIPANILELQNNHQKLTNACTDNSWVTNNYPQNNFLLDITDSIFSAAVFLHSAIQEAANLSLPQAKFRKSVKERVKNFRQKKKDDKECWKKESKRVEGIQKKRVSPMITT